MITSSAMISSDGLYRYTLTRSWDEGLAYRDGIDLWVMLNPSTADAALDDPTIRRCRGFSMRDGRGALAVVNLFAYRSTAPRDLYAALTAGVDVVGPANDAAIRELSAGAGRIICAWGKVGNDGRERVWRVVELLRETLPDVELLCLDTTKHGHPRHPLYVLGTQPLVPFTWPPDTVVSD